VGKKLKLPFILPMKFKTKLKDGKVKFKHSSMTLDIDITVDENGESFISLDMILHDSIAFDTGQLQKLIDAK
jgi:hypothetical protein